MPPSGGPPRAVRPGDQRRGGSGHAGDLDGSEDGPAAWPRRLRGRPVSPLDRRSLRRLLRDLGRGETRPQAVRRIRRGIGSRVAGAPLAAAGPATSARRAGAAGKPGKAAATGPGGRTPEWYVGSWGRLAGAIAGRNPALDPTPPDPAQGPDLLRAARVHRGRAAFAEALSQGQPLAVAVCGAVDALAAAREHSAAWSLAESVRRLPEGAAAGAAGHAVLLHRRRQFARAWTVLNGLDDALLRDTLPVEAVDAALAVDTAASRKRALDLTADPAVFTDAQLVDLAGRFLAVHDREQAGRLVAELRRRPPGGLDERREHVAGLLEGWVAPRSHDVPAGAVPVGVIDYWSPDHVLTSGNLGDNVQTLALVGHLARLSDVTFTGEDGLGEAVTEVQGLVQERFRRTGVGGRVHLVPVDRDVSTLADLPEGTWTIAFGWHMHPLFDLRYDFPYHPNLRPLFVSFHVNRLDMLDDEALAYLRAHGPVGCRDWTTVFLLLSAGVDAFFTGCLTSTVDTLFPSRQEAYRGAKTVGVIDRPAAGAAKGAPLAEFTHQSDEYRFLSAADGLRAAHARLGAYQRDLARVVTSRLHAYLPLTSLGVPVEFRPGSPGDVRFAGLAGLTPDDPALAAMRDGLRDLLAEVLGTIVSGGSEDEVRARWRELTADRVAQAKAAFAEPVQAPSPSLDVEATVRDVLAGRRRYGPHDGVDPADVTDLVLAFDENLTWPAAVYLQSVLDNASGPVRLWVLSRGIPLAYEEWLSAAFPAVPMTFVPCDAVSYETEGGPKRRFPGRITVSTMDRLFLPLLLPEVARVVYMDVDTLVLGDVTELARTDLDGHAVAVRDSNVTEASEWASAGRRLPMELATELRRSAGHAHGFGGAAINAGVLVMDLDRMRKDDFTARYLGLGERYGLHDQDTMLLYLGPDRVHLPARWNALPVHEDVEDPAVIHWASLTKPWEDELTHEQELWRSYADRVARRVGRPPVWGGPDARLEPLHVLGPSQDPLPEPVEAVMEQVRAEKLTYLDKAALRTLVTAVRDLEAAGVPGLVLEAGTARGGSAIAMAAAKAADRPMRVYDVFGMIPPPGHRDGADVHARYETIRRGQSTGVGGEVYYGYREDLRGEVTDSFARLGVPLDAHAVELVQGLFEDTLVVDGPVALAHLDGDWYDSTMVCLERIVPHLSVGGRIVVDDYDMWSGCRRAVDDYFAGRAGFRFERRGRLHVVRV